MARTDPAAPEAVSGSRSRSPGLLVAVACTGVLLLLGGSVALLRPADPKHAPAPEGPPVHVGLLLDGRATRGLSTAPLVTGHRYTFSVQVSVAGGGHVDNFRLVIAGPRSGMDSGRPSGEFAPVLSVSRPADSFTASGSWLAEPVGRSNSLTVAAVLSIHDAKTSSSEERTLITVRLR